MPGWSTCFWIPWTWFVLGSSVLFVTTPTYFVGDVVVEGAPGRPTESQIINATKLQLGELFTRDKVDRALKNISRLMEDNAYYRSSLQDEEKTNAETQQIAIFFKMHSGPQARVGHINVTGNPGYSVSATSAPALFRRST